MEKTGPKVRLTAALALVIWGQAGPGWPWRLEVRVTFPGKALACLSVSSGSSWHGRLWLPGVLLGPWGSGPGPALWSCTCDLAQLQPAAPCPRTQVAPHCRPRLEYMGRDGTVQRGAGAEGSGGRPGGGGPGASQAPEGMEVKG